MPTKSRSKLGLVLAAIGAAAVIAGVALKLAGGGGTGSATPPGPDPGLTTALQADADKLASTLDAEAKASRLRAESIAVSPVLRAGIETDAATVKDLATSEHLFAPKQGEVIEVMQQRGEQEGLLLRVPDGPPIPGPKNGQTIVETDGQTLTVIAAAPVLTQAGVRGGEIVVATAIDLGPIKHALADHTLGATLLGLGKPIELVKTTQNGTPLTVHVPAMKDLKVNEELLLSLVVAGQAADAKKSYGAISYAFLGMGGAMLLLYLGSLLRGRREG
jgi:hypothetical protein